MSCIEIDKAKKEFIINNAKELKKITEKYKDLLTDENNKNVKPQFFEFLNKSKGYYIKGVKSYIHHETSMDYLSLIMKEKARCKRKQKEDYILLSNVFEPLNYDSNSRNLYQLKSIRDLCYSYINKKNAIWSNDDYETEDKVLMCDRIKEEMLYTISNMSINETTTYELIKTIDMDKYSEIKGTIMFLLFCSNNNSMNNLLNCMKKDNKINKYSHFNVEFEA